MELNMTNLLWFFAFIFLAGGNGFGGLFGGRAPMGPPPATQQDLTAALNNQTLQSELNALGISTANNNYETARLIQEQNLLMQQRESNDMMSVIQNFNNLLMQITNQNAVTNQKIDALGFQMNECCCKIQTQMLENRLADKTAEALALQNKLDNAQQTQTILGNLGRFVAWAGSGSQAAAGAIAGA